MSDPLVCPHCRARLVVPEDVQPGERGCYFCGGSFSLGKEHVERLRREIEEQKVPPSRKAASVFFRGVEELKEKYSERVLPDSFFDDTSQALNELPTVEQTFAAGRSPTLDDLTKAAKKLGDNRIRSEWCEIKLPSKPVSVRFQTKLQRGCFCGAWWDDEEGKELCPSCGAPTCRLRLSYTILDSTGSPGSVVIRQTS